MQAIIIGCGKVGDSLAYHLTKEKCNVNVIDINKELVDKVTRTYDVNGICGNAATREILWQANVENTDILIAVTDSDEVNTLCCLIGKALGAKYTIARVRKPEYSKQQRFMSENLGIDLMINPDSAAAGFISRVLRYPSSLRIESFSRGRVHLIEVNIKEDNPLANKKVSEITANFDSHVIICSVTRGDEVFIPNGDFILKAKDRIFVTAPTSELTNFFKTTNTLKNKIRNVMIIGGGSISYYVANQLDDMNIDVRIIELNEDKSTKMSMLLPNSTIIQGDGTDPKLLEEENIESMDACVSLTGMDEENIIISLFAHSKKINKIITKINRTAFVKIIDNASLGTIVTPKEIMVNRIVRYVRAKINSEGSNVQTLHKLIDDRVEAVEFKIAKDAKCVNIPLKDLSLKKDLIVACIIRNDEPIFPNGNDYFLPNDNVIVVTKIKYLSDIDDILEEENWQLPSDYIPGYEVY